MMDLLWTITLIGAVVGGLSSGLIVAIQNLIELRASHARLIARGAQLTTALEYISEHAEPLSDIQTAAAKALEKTAHDD